MNTPTVHAGNLRARLGEFRQDARYVMQDIADLWPVMRRATADRRELNAADTAFEMGREREQHDAKRRREAPAVGAVLRAPREAMGLSVAEVAARAGVGPDYLERVEQGTEVAPESFRRDLARILSECMAEARR